MIGKPWNTRDARPVWGQDHPHATTLVVEDFEGVREALAELLATEGFPTVSAANGARALEYLRTHPAPGLILLDLVMPEMDGWEFIRTCREDPELAHIPIILLSGVEDLRQQGPGLHVEGYLRKPVDPEILLQVVEMYCG